MKNKNLLLIIALFFSTLIVYGQAPQRIDFQAMARDGSGNPMINQNIAVKITVKEGATTVYAERHTLTTDDYGLFTLPIGEGTPISGSFAAIDWSLGNQRVKVEVDPDGGTSYVFMGTSDLASTPYAFYGEDDDADPTNELQTLSLSGSDLSISDGNTVTLPGGGSSLWSQNGDDIYYNDGNVGIGIDSPDYGNNPPDAKVLTINAATTGGADEHPAVLEFRGSDADNGGLLGKLEFFNWQSGNNYPMAKMEVVRSSQANTATSSINFFTRKGGISTYTSKMTINDDGHIGIGTTDPLVKLHVVESGSDGVLGSDLGVLYSSSQNLSPAVFGWAENNTSDISSGVLGHAYSTTSAFNEGVFGEGGGGTYNNYGVYGVGYGQSGSTYSIAVYGDDQGAATTNYAGYFSGDVHVNGALSKSGGSFKIDHPQDPANKYLIHSFVESPDMMNVYNGNVVTDAEGLAIVKLPSYFEAENLDFKYQLTVIGQFAQAIIKEEVSGNRFTIQTDKPNVKVSWQVTGVRDDAWANAHRIVPEVEKKGVEKGKYLHPELFGKSKDLGMPVGIPQNAQYKQGSHKQAVKSASEAIGPLGVKK